MFKGVKSVKYISTAIQPQGPLLEAQDVPIQAWSLASADAGSQEHISKNLEALLHAFWLK